MKLNVVYEPPRPVAPANRGLAAAKSIAVTQSIDAERACIKTPPNSWTDFTATTKLTPDIIAASSPCNMVFIKQFLARWVGLAGARYEKSLESTGVESITNVARVTIDTGGSVTFKPQQRKAIDQTIDVLFTNPKGNAVLCPLQTGKGKSYIAAGIINHIQSKNYFDRKWILPTARVVFVTRKSVAEKIRRTLRDKFHIKGVGNGLFGYEVAVISYSELARQKNAMLFGERIENHNGTEVKLITWRVDPPEFIVWDESQDLKKWDSKRTKYARAFTDSPITKHFFTSATAFVTLNDLTFFGCAAKIDLGGGQSLTKQTWPLFTARFNCDPNKPNGRVTREVIDFLGPLVVDPPNDPQKFKARNRVIVYKFKSPKQEALYRAAEEEYIESLAQIGKDYNPENNKMARFQIFRAKAELLKADFYIEDALELHAKGFAPVIAVCYQNTLTTTVLGLVRAGVSRDNISVIWGGEKQIGEDETFVSDLHKYHAMVELKGKIDRDELPDDEKAFELAKYTRKDWARYNKTVKYLQDRFRRGETASQTQLRREELKLLRLDKQSDEERQSEIDLFQSGKTEYCIYTLSAGGTGVDLDQQVVGVRPRAVRATLCYWAEEFKQALGRCLRIATLSDVEQGVGVFENTIESQHVAPILAKKIEAIGKISTVNGGDDLVGMLETAIEKKSLGALTVDTSVKDDDAVVLDDEDEDDDDDAK